LRSATAHASPQVFPSGRPGRHGRAHTPAPRFRQRDSKVAAPTSQRGQGEACGRRAGTETVRVAPYKVEILPARADVTIQLRPVNRRPARPAGVPTQGWVFRPSRVDGAARNVAQMPDAGLVRSEATAARRAGECPRGARFGRAPLLEARTPAVTCLLDIFGVASAPGRTLFRHAATTGCGHVIRGRGRLGDGAKRRRRAAVRGAPNEDRCRPVRTASGAAPGCHRGPCLPSRRTHE
jgi:hypothetical protein